MRKTTYLERAVITGILIVAAILLLALYPFRKFRREVVLPRDDFPVAEAVTVNEETLVVQRFQTEFEKLAAIEIYVESLDGGRYMQVHLNEIYGPERANRYIDLAKEKIPGYVRVPLEVEVPIDAPKMIDVCAIRSSFRLQTEDVSALPAEWDTQLFSAGELQEGSHLRMRILYDLPVDGKTTILRGGIILLAALLLCAAVHLFFKKFPQYNRLIVVRDAWKRVIQVLTAAFFATIFVMNFPLKRFDAYAGEILFYAVGIALAAAIAFYVIHRLFGDISVTIMPLWRSWLMSACLALAIYFSVNYVNGFYDIFHFIAMRQLAICLFVLLIAAVFPKDLLRPVSLVYLPCAAFAVFWYVRQTVAAAEEAPDEMHMKLIRLKALLMAFLGYVILLMLLRLADALRKRAAAERLQMVTGAAKRISPYGLLTILTAVCLMVFANGRLWVFNLVILYVLLYAGIFGFGLKEQWFRIFSEGVMMHFLASLLYSLLHRAYQHWYFHRFPFVFSTVTVTGGYLVLVLAVASVRLVLKLQTLPKGTSVKECFRAACLEFFFFGTVAAYLVLTVTRLAWVSAAGMLVVALFLAGKNNRLRTAGMMCAAVLLLFIPVFTMQRIVPSLVSDHRAAGGWEDSVTFGSIRGTIPTDSPFYMRFGRFIDIVGARLSHGEISFPMRPVDPLNYDAEGRPLYAHDGTPLQLPDGSLMEEPLPESAPQEEETVPAEGAEPSGDSTDETVAGPGLAGGRVAVWKAYLAELDMKGHETMSNENTIADHAHNTYLQAMFDHGIPAGLLFSAWIGITIVTAGLRYRKKRDAMSLLQTVLTAGFAFVSLAEWTFHPGNPLTLMFLAVIVTLMTRERETE
ncbi:MAG: hypothetical protein IJR00_04055 [Lachnospiraceae bacterium]|nr:hypothetical protein [Lachnospiraceae bacterium]